MRLTQIHPGTSQSGMDNIFKTSHIFILRLRTYIHFFRNFVKPEMKNKDATSNISHGNTSDVKLHTKHPVMLTLKLVLKCGK